MEKKFYLKSLGCKQNQLEGQIIEDDLISKGYVLSDIKNADIYILNSCTVTSRADSQAKYLINRAKRLNPNVITVLTGCYAQTYKEHKNFKLENIDLIIGNSEKLNLDKYIENFKNKIQVKNIFEKKEFENKFLYNPKSTRVSVKIQDGCDCNCAYCIIPRARGFHRSNKIENIIKQIEILLDKNVKEIVLTGIHIGQWGKEWGLDLIDLLKEIEKTAIPRYRLGSLYINEINDEFLEFLSQSKKFCPHFHLSLQSLCDKTLKNMGRKYSAKDALNIIEKIKNLFHLPYLGCDIIVGFPDETQEDFIETYNNLKIAKLSSIHCFPYSKRENTKAYNMPNQIQETIKTKRAKLVMDLGESLHKEFLEQNKQETTEVLIQKKSSKTGLYSAVTKNYIKIFIKSDELNLRHTFKTVCLKDFELM